MRKSRFLAIYYGIDNEYDFLTISHDGKQATEQVNKTWEELMKYEPCYLLPNEEENIPTLAKERMQEYGPCALCLSCSRTCKKAFAPNPTFTFLCADFTPIPFREIHNMEEGEGRLLSDDAWGEDHPLPHNLTQEVRT